jgi:hypothetical protein
VDRGVSKLEPGNRDLELLELLEHCASLLSTLSQLA